MRATCGGAANPNTIKLHHSVNHYTSAQRQMNFKFTPIQYDYNLCYIKKANERLHVRCGIRTHAHNSGPEPLHFT